MVLVDFKTDKIGKQMVAKRTELYQTQLGLYARAIRSILHVPVTQAYLYFLHPGVLFPVNVADIAMKT
jgi:ATP-dependent helicase/nuclease subunit A